MDGKEAGNDAVSLHSLIGIVQLAAVLRHVVIVLFDGAGEIMATLVIGNEIKVVGLLRMHRRFERLHARIGDWAGRQANIFVSVVRRGECEV